MQKSKMATTAAPFEWSNDHLSIPLISRVDVYIMLVSMINLQSMVDCVLVGLGRCG